MKSRDGKSQRREEKKKEIKKRKSQKKEDPGAGKGRKVAKHRVFPMICGSGGSNSRLAKAWQVQSQLARGEMKNCAPLWREASQRRKKPPDGSDHSWKLRCRKSARRCGAKHISKSKVSKTDGSDHSWKLRCRKSARRCGAKHISKSKVSKTDGLGPLLEGPMSKKCTPLWRDAHVEVKSVKADRFGALLEVEMSKKCTPLWRKAHFEVKNVKTPHAQTTFWRSDVVSRGRRKGVCTLSKVSKTWRLCSISKNDGMHGTFEEDLQRCIFRGRRSTRDIFIRAVRRSGRWFPERGCILEHQIFRLRSSLDRWNRKTHWHEAVPHCTQLSIFEGHLAELLRFWCCQRKKMRTSHRIVSFLMLSSSKIEEVSQNCFVFGVVKFKTWGRLAELLRSQACR